VGQHNKREGINFGAIHVLDRVLYYCHK